MRIYPLKLIPDNTNFAFMKLRNFSYSLSIALSILSIIWVISYKFNFGIDFAGGIAIEVRTDKKLDLAETRQILGKLDLGEVMLQNFGSDLDLSIRIGASKENDSAKTVEKVKETLKKRFKNYNFDYRKIDFVGPQVGRSLIESGIIATVLSFLAIMTYVWFRFEWFFGVGVFIALLHDLILAIGFMSVTRLDFNLSTIAAILTILGYSVNDSVVIYDRIRENTRKYKSKNLSELIDLSVNETLSRTILTVVTTLLATLSLVLFGGEALRSFSLLVFFGIIAGTYSSIFVSAPILTLLTKEK